MWKQNLLVAVFAVAASGQTASYPDALAAYRAGNFSAAEVMFRSITEQDEPAPETIKARYFLSRTLMKQRRFDEAASLLIDIHRRSPLFYREWACDFLLGECRVATGRD